MPITQSNSGSAAFLRNHKPREAQATEAREYDLLGSRHAEIGNRIDAARLLADDIQVGIRPAAQRVVALAAFDNVAPGARADDVIATPAGQAVVRRVARQRIGAVAAEGILDIGGIGNRHRAPRNRRRAGRQIDAGSARHRRRVDGVDAAVGIVERGT